MSLKQVLEQTCKLVVFDTFESVKKQFYSIKMRMLKTKPSITCSKFKPNDCLAKGDIQIIRHTLRGFITVSSNDTWERKGRYGKHLESFTYYWNDPLLQKIHVTSQIFAKKNQREMFHFA
jgi:hypothetical protein